MVNSTFQQIEAFLIAAERLNLTETAEAMYISQSALSKMITRLESAIGVKLFTRENRGVSLTDEGKFLYSVLKEPFETITRALDEVYSLQTRPKKFLRIGCPSTYEYNSTYNLIKRAIEEFSTENPGVDVSETILEYTSQKNALTFSELDLMVTQSFVVKTLKGVSYLNIAPLQTCFAMSDKHRLAKFDDLPYEELAEETFYEVLVGNRQAIERNVLTICRAMGFVPRAVKMVPNMPSLIRALGAGKGVSICGRIDKTSTDVSLRCYPMPKRPGIGEHSIVIAWRTDDASAEAQRFLEKVRSLMASRHAVSFHM